MPTELLKRLVPARPDALDVLGTFEARHGAPLPQGEFRRYLKLAGELDFSPLSHRAIEVLAPDIDSLSERLERGVYVERIQSLLCASSIIARREDTFFAASWASNADGGSRVYYLHKDKWGMHLARSSIASFVFKMLDLEPEVYRAGEISEQVISRYRQARRRYERDAKARLVRPATLDPERIFGRVEWLIDFFLYVFKGYNVSRWEERLAQAAPFSAYSKERGLLVQWPHLAVYWLWSHFLFGNSEALSEARMLLANHPNAAVRESLALIDDVSHGAGRRGPRERAEKFCQEIAVDAPERVFSPQRRGQRREARRGEKKALFADEQAALKSLRQAAQLEPSVAEALVLLEELDRGEHAEGDARWRSFEPQRRFGELVDMRFEPLLRRRIERGARFTDEHRRATRGVVYAYAQIVERYSRFISVVDEAGVTRFGGDRLSEFYRAVGCFDDRDATQRLLEGAERYVAGGDSAEGTLHKAAFWQLLRRDAPEGQHLITGYLARFDPLSRLADQWTCINAILAAGRQRLVETHDDILRLVGEVGIGYYTNEEHRGPLLRTLWQTGEDSAFEALSALLMGHYARSVEAGPGTDEWAKQTHDESCLVAALHMMRPSDPVNRARFEQLGSVYAALEMAVSPLCFYGMSALLRAIDVAKLSGHEAMVDGLARHRARPKYPHLEGLAERVRELARSLLQQ